MCSKTFILWIDVVLPRFQLSKDLIRIFCNIIPFANELALTSQTRDYPWSPPMVSFHRLTLLLRPLIDSRQQFSPQKWAVVKQIIGENLIYPQFTLVPLSILNSDRVQMRPKSFSMEMQPHVLFFHRFIPQFYGAFLFSVDLIRTRVETLQARTRQCVSNVQQRNLVQTKLPWNGT